MRDINNMAEGPHTIHFENSERGSIAIMAAFSLMMVILITSFVYDFGLWFVTKAEMQNVADAAALAGGRALGARHAGGRFFDGTEFRDPERKPYSTQLAGLLGDEPTWIQNAIIHSGNSNLAGGIPIPISTTDIMIGNWKSDTNVFNEALFPKNAVEVTVRRDGLAAMFGQLVGLTGANFTATATAALTPLKYVPPATPPAEFPPGQIILPLGIDQWVLPEGNFCGEELELNGDAIIQPCGAGWTTFNNSDLATFDGMATALATGASPTTPQTLAENIGTNETEYFFGGSWETKQEQLRTIWERYDPPNDDLDTVDAWETLLPVYQNNSGVCLPLTGQRIPIVGFVSVFIDGNTGVRHAKVTYQCDVVGVGRSGDVNDPNLDYGTVGSVPVLVQ